LANKRKILEAARKYAQKGAKDKALKEYETLLKLDPKDARLRIEIGDAYRRWGQVEDAIATYSKVAQQYMADGFDARAVAVYKQIQNLDPDHWASYEPLGELYQRMGLTAEAINTLQTAADGHHRAGNKREALELLRKMATIDPSNTASRLKVADLLHQESMKSEAIAEYQAVVEELEGQGEREQAARALERILEIDPEHDTALVQMVVNLIARGLHDQAEPFAKRSMERAPEDPEHYERLAEIYRAQHREDALKDVYQRLAEVYRQRGDEDRARDIIQRFVPPDGFEVQPESELELGEDSVLESDVSDFLADEDLVNETLLEDEFVAVEDASPAAAPSRPPVSEETVLVRGREGDEGPDLDELTDLDDLVADDPQPSPASSLDLGVDAPSQATPEGDPDQLLAEACVYLRYGKRAQAIENLNAILAGDGGHRGALEKLGEAHAEGGDAEQAVAQWMKAADRAREDGDRAALAVLRDRIGALDPVAAGSLAPAVGESDPELDSDLSDSGIALEAEPESGSAPEEEIDLGDLDIEVDDSELDDGALDVDLDLADDAGEGAAEAGSLEANDLATGDLDAAVSGSGASISLSVQVGEDLEEADFYVQQGLLDEAESIYKRILEKAPNHPQALVRLGEIAAARGEDPGSSGERVEAAQAEPEELLDVPDVEREPAEMPGETLDIADDLDDWTDGESDGLDLDLIDADAGDAEEAEASEIDPNAETDLDFDADAAADAEASVSASSEDVETAIPAPALEEQSATPLALGDDADASEHADVPEEAPDEEEFVSLDLDDDPDGDSDGAFGAEEVLAATGPDGATPATSAFASDGADDGFDLAAELSGAFDDDPNGASISGTLGGDDDGFAAVFQAFKKGVRDTLSDGDHQAHYDLGIAYKEMGLLDDAMGEFRAAMADAGRRLDCLQMLGLCSLERECGEEAVAHFQEALALDGLGDDQVLALRFDLGRAFESVGDTDQAREAWEAVAAADPNFCDVGERLASLDKPDEAPEVGVDTSPTEAFESFEDVIGDAEHDDAPDEQAADTHVDFDDLVAEANADDDAADAESHEDFQDLVSELSADPEESQAEVEASPVAQDEVDAAPAEAAEEASPGDGGGDDPGSEETEEVPAAKKAPDPPARRRKKKISFV